MYYRQTMHQYPDNELINATTLASMCGVSQAAITKAKRSNRIDSFENSDGKERFHKIRSAEQFMKTRDRRHVTTPTTAQRNAGFDKMTAQAVAHLPRFDVPSPGFGAKISGVPDADDPLDFAEAAAESADLATSKAEKEFQMARLAKLKADEMEGRLVPKQKAAIVAYQLGANIQDKIMTIYSQLAPEIVGYFKEMMVKSGIDNEKVIEVTADANHYVGEKIRKACWTALKDLTEKTEENILDG